MHLNGFFRFAVKHIQSDMNENDISSKKIKRFQKSERWVHWAIAIPFIACYATGLILALFYYNKPTRPFRDIFSIIHQISGACLIILPAFVIVKSRKDFKLYLYNVKQAFVWTVEDFKWLFLKGIATVNKKIDLPKQGKFNAAEKLNFMILTFTYPLYILTGLSIWFAGSTVLSWLVHVGMAVIATPFLFGHIFMATLNPDTRVSLSGMITGFVDRHYVKHHHALWYKEKFEQPDDSVDKH